jgi:hypothetical protein
MVRKQRTKGENSDSGTPTEASATVVAVGEYETPGASETPAASSPVERPAWIDGPPTSMGGDEITQAEAGQPRNWGDPYKQIFSSTAKGFEMGENRRFKQRVFKFHERPDQDVLDLLKDNGFTYRAAEKAWTIQATPETRRLSEELAHQLSGESPGHSR